MPLLPEDSVLGEHPVVVQDRANIAFYHDDLTAVTNAARGWCDANRYRLEITSNQGAGTPRWLVRIKFEGDDRGFQARDDLAEALLTAAVEAARKLKET